MPPALGYKTFIKAMRSIRLIETPTAKLFLTAAKLLNDEPLPPEVKNHALQGEWNDFLELHLSGDRLLIYQTDEQQVYLTRLDSHAQLFKSR